MAIKISEKKSLATQETANYLGMSKSTVYRMVKLGLLVPSKTPGGQKRFSIEELEEYKEKSKKNTFKKEKKEQNITSSLLKYEEELSDTKETEGVYDSRNSLNNLTGKQWIPETKSFWYQKGLGSKHPHAQIERQHPAPFSYQDISRLVSFFTKEGEVVLDPFSGVGSTIKACAIQGRTGIGIELSEKWNNLAKGRIELEVGEGKSDKHIFINGDSIKELKKLKENSIDFMVTSPPYWSILNKKADHKVKKERLDNNLVTNYSDDDKDLGNIEDYNEFLNVLVNKVFLRSAKLLKNGKYMCLVVSDFRNKSDFISFHSDLIHMMNKLKIDSKHELNLQGVKALLQNHKSLLPYGYPFAYVENIHHQYILIFRKMEIKTSKRKKA